MSSLSCDKKIPISGTWKKVRTNDPEYFYETGSRTAMQFVQVAQVPLGVPKSNAFNSVLVGKIDKQGIGEFKRKGSIHFTPDTKNPQIVASIPIDLKQLKKGKGLIIGSPTVLATRSAVTPNDYSLFQVKAVDLDQKFVCLELRPTKNIRFV